MSKPYEPLVNGCWNCGDGCQEPGGGYECKDWKPKSETPPPGMMQEEECFKGVPHSDQGQVQECHDGCEHQEFQSDQWPLTKEELLSDDYEGDWDGGWGCHWMGWKD